MLNEDTINGYLDNIRNAQNGETVRDTIIQLMNAINLDTAIKLQPFNLHAKLSDVSRTPYKPDSGYAFSQVTLDIEDDTGEEKNETDLHFDEIEINNETDPHAELDSETLLGEGHYWKTIKTNIDLVRPDDIVDCIEVSVNDVDGMFGISAEDWGWTSTKRIQFVDWNGGSSGSGGGAGGGQPIIGPDGSTRWKVTFKDSPDNGGKVLDEVTVLDGGTAKYTGAKPVMSGKRFSGWDPYPSNVHNNIEVEAVYTEPVIIASPLDDIPWETIVRDRGMGANYPVGCYKSLTLHGNIPYAAEKNIGMGDRDSGVYLYENELVMVKVAEGEDGTGSTWLSTQIRDVMPDSGSYPWTRTYEESVATIWRNTILLPYTFPRCLSRNSGIKAVEKWYVSGDDKESARSYSVQNRIWIPSVKELACSDDKFMDEATYPTEYENYNYFVDKNSHSMNYMENIGITEYALRDRFLDLNVEAHGSGAYPYSIQTRDDFAYSHQYTMMMVQIRAENYEEEGTPKPYIAALEHAGLSYWKSSVIGFCL